MSSNNDFIFVRKNVNSLTSAELVKLRSAFKKAMKLNDNRGFAHFAGFHGYPDWRCWHGPQSKDGWPGVRLFFPWHRAYLYTFERTLQDLEPGVTIPWWDWRSSEKAQSVIPKAFSDEFISSPTEAIQKEFLKPFYDIVNSKDVKKIRQLLTNALKSSKQKEAAKKIIKAFIDKLPATLKSEFSKNINKLFSQAAQKTTITAGRTFCLVRERS